SNLVAELLEWTGAARLVNVMMFPGQHRLLFSQAPGSSTFRATPERATPVLIRKQTVFGLPVFLLIKTMLGKRGCQTSSTTFPETPRRPGFLPYDSRLGQRSITQSISFTIIHRGR